MLQNGPAKKVTIYINEDARYRMTSLDDAIMTFLMHHQVAGATATRAYAGFGSHHVLHTPRIELMAQHLPIRIEFIESAEKVEELLPMLYEMTADGMIEVQDTTVIRSPASEPSPARRHRVAGPAKMLRIFMGEDDKRDGEPLYDAIVKRLRYMEIAGATVYRGILGYGAKGVTHKKTFFHPVRDLPVMIAVVDVEERIAAAVAAVEGMLDNGLIVISDVEVIRVVRGKEGTDAAASG